MIRVKFVQDFGGYRSGEINFLKDGLARKLIGQGIATLTKDMTGKDYIVRMKSRKRITREKANGDS